MIQKWGNKYFITSKLTGKILAEHKLLKEAKKHLKLIIKNQFKAT